MNINFEIIKVILLDILIFSVIFGGWQFGVKNNKFNLKNTLNIIISSSVMSIIINLT